MNNQKRFPDKNSQIMAILRKDWVDWAGTWFERVDLSSLTYSEVFNVTPEEVYAYVLQFGWDRDRVQELGILPANPAPRTVFYLYPDSGQWVAASSGDRGEWFKTYFNTLSEARMHVINALIHSQWSYWNGRNRSHCGLNGSLHALYSPAPQMEIKEVQSEYNPGSKGV